VLDAGAWSQRGTHDELVARRAGTPTRGRASRRKRSSPSCEEGAPKREAPRTTSTLRGVRRGQGLGHALALRLAREARPHWKLFAGTLRRAAVLFALELAGPWIMRHASTVPCSAALAARSADPGRVRSPRYAARLWTGPALRRVRRADDRLPLPRGRALARTGQTVVAGLRTKVFEHIQGLDLAWFDKRPTGRS
jgi:hypothetical protein